MDLAAVDLVEAPHEDNHIEDHGVVLRRVGGRALGMLAIALRATDAWGLSPMLADCHRYFLDGDGRATRSEQHNRTHLMMPP